MGSVAAECQPEAQSGGIEARHNQVTCRRVVVICGVIRGIVWHRIHVSDVIRAVVRRPRRVPVRVVPQGIPTQPPIASPGWPTRAKAPAKAKAACAKDPAPTITRPEGFSPSVAESVVPPKAVPAPAEASTKASLAKSVKATEGIETRVTKELCVRSEARVRERSGSGTSETRPGEG